MPRYQALLLPISCASGLNSLEERHEFGIIDPRGEYQSPATA
jgi:hypothetical protein